MFLKAGTLDDLLRQVFKKLLNDGELIRPSRGRAREITGVLLKLDNPRARLSRTESKGKLFSALGELLWYLAKTNGLAFINYYLSAYAEESDDGETVYGGYGPRLFDMRGHDQVANVISTLRNSSSSRRAVIQLFDAADLAKRRIEIPCTCTLQFMIRRRRLHMFTYMRSNDAYLGLSHDVFAFTMLQEIIARSLDVQLGTYSHAVGSLHLYERHRKQAEQYLKEGWQSTSAMPRMPAGDPWPAIALLVQAERALRTTTPINTFGALRPYWQDIVRLLQIFCLSTNRKAAAVKRLQSQMSTTIYDVYIAERVKIADRPLSNTPVLMKKESSNGGGSKK